MYDASRGGSTNSKYVQPTALSPPRSGQEVKNEVSLLSLDLIHILPQTTSRRYSRIVGCHRQSSSRNCCPPEMLASRVAKQTVLVLVFPELHHSRQPITAALRMTSIRPVATMENSTPWRALTEGISTGNDSLYFLENETTFLIF